MLPFSSETIALQWFSVSGEWMLPRLQLLRTKRHGSATCTAFTWLCKSSLLIYKPAMLVSSPPCYFLRLSVVPFLLLSFPQFLFLLINNSQISQQEGTLWQTPGPGQLCRSIFIRWHSVMQAWWLCEGQLSRFRLDSRATLGCRDTTGWGGCSDCHSLGEVVSEMYGNAWWAQVSGEQLQLGKSSSWAPALLLLQAPPVSPCTSHILIACPWQTAELSSILLFPGSFSIPFKITSPFWVFQPPSVLFLYMLEAILGPNPFCLFWAG